MILLLLLFVISIMLLVLFIFYLIKYKRCMQNNESFSSASPVSPLVFQNDIWPIGTILPIMYKYDTNNFKGTAMYRNGWVICDRNDYDMANYTKDLWDNTTYININISAENTSKFKDLKPRTNFVKLPTATTVNVPNTIGCSPYIVDINDPNIGCQNKSIFNQTKIKENYTIPIQFPPHSHTYLKPVRQPGFDRHRDKLGDDKSTGKFKTISDKYDNIDTNPLDGSENSFSVDTTPSWFGVTYIIRIAKPLNVSQPINATTDKNVVNIVQEIKNSLWLFIHTDKTNKNPVANFSLVNEDKMMKKRLVSTTPGLYGYENIGRPRFPNLQLTEENIPRHKHSYNTHTDIAERLPVYMRNFNSNKDCETKCVYNTCHTSCDDQRSQDFHLYNVLYVPTPTSTNVQTVPPIPDDILTYNTFNTEMIQSSVPLQGTSLFVGTLIAIRVDPTATSIPTTLCDGYLLLCNGGIDLDKTSQLYTNLSNLPNNYQVKNNITKTPNLMGKTLMGVTSQQGDADKTWIQYGDINVPSEGIEKLYLTKLSVVSHTHKVDTMQADQEKDVFSGNTLTFNVYQDNNSNFTTDVGGGVEFDANIPSYLVVYYIVSDKQVIPPESAISVNRLTFSTPSTSKNILSEMSTTLSNYDGGGNVHFLDRHNVTCGPRQALGQFNLWREKGGGNYHIDYHCRYSPAISDQAGASNTKDSDTDGGKLVTLDRHPVGCTDNQVLSRWQLHTLPNSDNIQIDYNCVNVDNLGSCRLAQTGFTDDGEHRDTTFLDRQNASCNDDEVLKGFKLSRSSDGNQIRFDLNCCKLP